MAGSCSDSSQPKPVLPAWPRHMLFLGASGTARRVFLLPLALIPSAVKLHSSPLFPTPSLNFIQVWDLPTGDPSTRQLGGL